MTNETDFKIDILPTSREGFETWSDEVIAEAGIPNNRSTKFTLAMMVMHLAPTEDVKPREFFVKSLHKAAVNEVMHAVLTEIKEEQQKQRAAEAARQQEEAKAQQAAVTNEQQQ